MGERRIDDERYVWEYSNWTGTWEPVRDNWGNHVREGGGTWWGSGEREERGGGCFITTACADHLGLPDDCEELRRFRGFRDGYVRGLGGEGKASVRDYYLHAPAVVAAINAAPPEERDAAYADIHLRMREVLRLLDRGREAEAYEYCMNTYENLKTCYYR